jgi:hypothetical protein
MKIAFSSAPYRMPTSSAFKMSRSASFNEPRGVMSFAKPPGVRSGHNGEAFSAQEPAEMFDRAEPQMRTLTPAGFHLDKSDAFSMIATGAPSSPEHRVKVTVKTNAHNLFQAERTAEATTLSVKRLPSQEWNETPYVHTLVYATPSPKAGRPHTFTMRPHAPQAISMSPAVSDASETLYYSLGFTPDGYGQLKSGTTAESVKVQELKPSGPRMFDPKKAKDGFWIDMHQAVPANGIPQVHYVNELEPHEFKHMAGQKRFMLLYPSFSIFKTSAASDHPLHFLDDTTAEDASTRLKNKHHELLKYMKGTSRFFKAASTQAIQGAPTQPEQGWWHPVAISIVAVLAAILGGAAYWYHSHHTKQKGSVLPSTVPVGSTPPPRVPPKPVVPSLTPAR